MLKLPVAKTAAGLTIRSGARERYLERSDGYFARCWSPGTAQQPYLYCNAYLRQGDVLLAYEFRTTEDIFVIQSARVDKNVIAVFDSLRSEPPKSTQ